MGFDLRAAGHYKNPLATAHADFVAALADGQWMRVNSSAGRVGTIALWRQVLAPGGLKKPQLDSKSV
jgi:hypothetical protein